MKTLTSIAVCAVLGCSVLMLTGCANRLAFATATKIGLDISQRADQTIEVSLAYDRQELVMIPSAVTPAKGGQPETKDATDDRDTYSLLGTLLVKYGNPFPPDPKPLVVHQFFATGFAAVKIAEDRKVQEVLGRTAGEIFKTGQQKTSQ